MSPAGMRRRTRRAFTVIELMSVMVIASVLSGMGMTRFRSVQDKARAGRAIGDIKQLQAELMALEAQYQPLPGSLSEIGRGDLRDPWGRPYVYVRFPANAPPPGDARTDAFGIPLNQTFDLYSMGPDGAYQPSVTAPESADDILRAGDGSVGLANTF